MMTRIMVTWIRWWHFSRSIIFSNLNQILSNTSLIVVIFKNTECIERGILFWATVQTQNDWISHNSSNCIAIWILESRKRLGVGWKDRNWIGKMQMMLTKYYIWGQSQINWLVCKMNSKARNNVSTSNYR